MVLALALPFLSLAFGYLPDKQDLDTAADMVRANVEDLNGWEISSLLWAAARLGYRPAGHVVEALLQQVLLPHSQRFNVPRTLSRVLMVVRKPLSCTTYFQESNRKLQVSMMQQGCESLGVSCA